MHTMRSETLEMFETSLRGELLRPGSDGYEEARKLWNGMIDKKPALIARCKSKEDVIDAVNFAREQGLTVAVRGGGHNVAGLASADDGIVIDLSEMNAVHVDPEGRVARVGGGARLADLDRETQAFGLAAPMGVVSETGVAGLTLSGGLGWLRNKHGLSCDNLIAAEVVTADGSVVRASEAENSELLWGLRGGGGNFGVVTSFEFRLHEVGPEVMFVLVLYPRAKAKEVLRAYRDYSERAPDEVSSIAMLGVVPDEPAYPEEIHGEAHVGLVGMYAGDPEEGERVLKPLRDLGKPLLDMSGVMPYVEVQQLLDEDYPDGRRYYWKSTYLSSLGDEVIDSLNKHGEAAPSSLSTVDIWALGGAMNRVEPGETAFGARNAPYLLAIEANWEDPAMNDANVRWARDCVKDMQRFGGGAYLNFPSFFEEEDTQLREIYGQNYGRLVALKTEYDPDNLFRLNQNIEPKGV